MCRERFTLTAALALVAVAHAPSSWGLIAPDRPDSTSNAREERLERWYVFGGYVENNGRSVAGAAHACGNS